MTEASDLVKKIADEDIAYVDIRFTDPRGKLQHVTVMENQVDEDFLADLVLCSTAPPLLAGNPSTSPT